MGRGLNNKRARLALAILVLVGAVAAGLLGRSSASASAPQASAKTAVDPVLNHFKCYTAVEVDKFKYLAPAVRLDDQFFPNGTFDGVGRANLHCNPVEKRIADEVTPIEEPKDLHLVCHPISEQPRPTAQPLINVAVNNQFGTARLTVTKVVSLCLPSRKSLTPLPDAPPIQPQGLDHFKCYAVVYTRDNAGRYVDRFEKVPGAAATVLVDQFGMSNPRVQGPKILCNPTRKWVDPAGPPTEALNIGHLVCFAVKDELQPPRVWVHNQFGVASLNLKPATSLCLPSGKNIVP